MAYKRTKFSELEVLEKRKFIADIIDILQVDDTLFDELMTRIKTTPVSRSKIIYNKPRTIDISTGRLTS